MSENNPNDDQNKTGKMLAHKKTKVIKKDLVRIQLQKLLLKIGILQIDILQQVIIT